MYICFFQSSYYSPDESDEAVESSVLDSVTLNDQENLPFETAKLEINPVSSSSSPSSSPSQSDGEEEEVIDRHRRLDLDVTPTTDQFHTPVGTLRAGGSLVRTPMGAEGGEHDDDTVTGIPSSVSYVME